MSRFDTFSPHAPKGSVAHPEDRRMLTVYTHPLSTFGRRIRIALLEKNQEARFDEVDMARKEHRSDAYLAKNPYGKLPTLVHDDFVLYESTAILQYLESCFPEPALYPASPKERALAEMHMKLCDLEFTSQSRALFFPVRFIAKEKWRMEQMEAARQHVRAHLAILDRHLEGRRYVVGETFSVVEVCYAPFLDFLEAAGVEAPPAVAAWHARVQERPSVAMTKLPR